MTFLWLALAAMLMPALPAYCANRTIYLTFDDGPLNGTSNILDVLEAAQVPATLFMVGMHAEASASNKALVRRAKAMPLVTIGNHSYSHAYNHYRHFYGDTEGVVADMLMANAVLGLKPAVHARLPGRDVFRLPSIRRTTIRLDRRKPGVRVPTMSLSRRPAFISMAGIASGAQGQRRAGAERRPSGQRDRSFVRLWPFRQNRAS
ncbi:polysaccharide deacetylase family protein [Mesorhizobium sp. B2-3-13]|uniref:polysaccharide deacetylase family protein n=1 Tax=Mesorhizobium sp. B2-3-13 TaxID=2589951 RepID=UPI001FEF515E|nr:polysaccharide deacetylase family protein [Mesorhizobium sp. B2-3-13]